MKTFHILNGDCLAEQLKHTSIEEPFIIFRECMIEGDVQAENLTEFWNQRANFICQNHFTTKETYFEKTVKEFEKIYALPHQAEVCLWFENDLFCQIHLWFLLSILAQQKELKLFRVFPILVSQNDHWQGFGLADTACLEQAYQQKIPYQKKDIELGENLWKAYQSHDFEQLKQLAQEKSSCFSVLPEVCNAHVDRFPLGSELSRPERKVREIIEHTSKDFEVVFAEFSKQEGIYGFGDAQLRKIYEEQMKNLGSADEN